jgi:hypothetical protein
MLGCSSGQYWSNRKWLRTLFYWTSLTILCSLAIRFLVGSDFHLRYLYLQPKHSLSIVDIRWFLKDLAFLLAFGVFLVRAALSQTPTSFLMWLIRFLAVAVLWCLLEMVLSHFWPLHAYVGKPWLAINSAELVTTFIAMLVIRKRVKWCPSAFTVLAICYVIGFCFDLQFIIEGHI